MLFIHGCEPIPSVSELLYCLHDTQHIVVLTFSFFSLDVPHPIGKGVYQRKSIDNIPLQSNPILYFLLHISLSLMFFQERSCIFFVVFKIFKVSTPGLKVLYNHFHNFLAE